jgi:hypothetical protein
MTLIPKTEMKRRHPLTTDLYEQLEGSRVRVTSRSGVSGVFAVNVRSQPPTVQWVSGDLHQADTHMAIWVAALRDFSSPIR